MDGILAAKAFMVGIIWGGSYLILFALVVHFFPLPQYYRLREHFAGKSSSVLREGAMKKGLRFALEKLEQGLSKWLRSLRVLRILLLLLLLLGLAIYVWTLNGILKQQLPQANLADFGPYYWLALPLPFGLLLWQAWRLYKRATRQVA